MRIVLAVLAVACGARGRAHVDRKAPVDNTARTASIDNEARPTEPPPAVDAADCKAFATAPALAIATVKSSTPDCSSIGHDRVVLDVQHLVRGSAIRTVIATRPLYGERLRAGATLVIAIEPLIEAAHTTACVPLPASEGTLAHAVAVASSEEAHRLVDAIADGRVCK